MDQGFTIIINKDGSSKVEAKGFIGPACTQVAEVLETLLGTVEDREFKPEYYQESVELDQSQSMQM